MPLQKQLANIHIKRYDLPSMTEFLLAFGTHFSIKSPLNALQIIKLYLKSRQFWIPQTYSEENENVTYSYSSNNEEGKSYTQPHKIPSHGKSHNSHDP